MTTGNVFRINAYSVPDGFEWNGRAFHLTYAYFLSEQRCLETVRRATSTPFYHSWCQEVGDDGHEHTHLALIFHSRIRLKGARHFDVPKLPGEIDPTEVPQRLTWHPNVQKITMTQGEVIWNHYHLGRKYNPETGKVEYTPPVDHNSILPPNFEWTREVIKEMRAADTLFEACIAGQIRPRSVQDVKTLRSEPEPVAKQFAHQYTKDQFTLPFPSQFTCLHVHGATNLGKTKYVLAQFNNPFYLKPFDSVGQLEKLKNFNPKIHDAIICDEANLKFMTREQAIAFADFDEDCTITVRFTSIDIPANTKKILISNPAPNMLWPHDPSGAVARRVQVMHITEKTYGPPPPQRPPRPLPPRPLPQQMTQFQTARAALAAGWSASDLAAAVRMP